jgi:hypothetical protein
MGTYLPSFYFCYTYACTLPASLLMLATCMLPPGLLADSLLLLLQHM